jgi:hypothetical protein
MTWTEIENSTRQRILDANDLLDAIDEAEEESRADADKNNPKRP